MVFLYNLLDLKRTIWEGPGLKAGKHTIVFDFKSDGPGLGKGGTGVLSVDGKEVARNSMEHTIPVTFPEDETFDVGQDTRTGVALLEYRYDAPFKFTGKINKLTFKLEPEQKRAKQQLRPRELARSGADCAMTRQAGGLTGCLPAVGGAGTHFVAVPVEAAVIAIGVAGIACRLGAPAGRPAAVGMLIYSAAVTLYLAYSVRGGLSGCGRRLSALVLSLGSSDPNEGWARRS